MTRLAIILSLFLPPLSAQALEMCQSRDRYTCLVDGDTMWLEGEKLRMMGYDTPEPQTNICGGAAEVALAKRASARTLQLFNQSGATIERHGKDKYGRTLVVVRVGGERLGDILVREGLARYWPNGREFWCN